MTSQTPAPLPRAAPELYLVPLFEPEACPGLTAAERRVLPLLTANLTFTEISAELSVPRDRIKTEAISIYRKLGVSSREA